MNTARMARGMTIWVAGWMAFVCFAGAGAGTPSHRKGAPNAAHKSAPQAAPDAAADAQERFLLLSADGYSITQTAFATARQCEAERKRTLRTNPRLARYVSQGDVDFECVADDAGSDLPYEASIIDKTTGLRADFFMRTQTQCEIGMSHAKAAARRYTIVSSCHRRPAAQA